MKEQTKFEEFMSNLAERQRNENDLSDITWAMCQTSPEFKQAFIKFFFEEEIDLKHVTNFRRENTENKGKAARFTFIKKMSSTMNRMYKSNYIC